jgi:hypothetical protein
LEVYLGENGLYCRNSGDLEGEPVPAGADAEPLPPQLGTPLYIFG